MLTLLGILLFAFLLIASVAIHEAGHLMTAKAFGMKATEYFIGFGPKIWSFRRGETEYGLKAIPAGGYVKIIGMTDLDKVDPEDSPRAFYRFSAPKKLIVLSAGSIAHMFIGFFLFAFVLMALGTPTLDTKVGAVSECIVADGAALDTTCKASDAASPAKAAGLRAGDQVLAVAGTPVKEWADATAAIRRHGAGPIEIKVRRDGEEKILNPVLVARERTDPVTGDKITAGVLGASASVAMHKDGPIAAGKRSVELVGTTIKMTGQIMVKIPDKIPALFHALTGGERDSNGLVGVVGVARISGEVLAQGEVPLSARIGNIVAQMAALNIFIGLFNALPLLPLDGGHMAVVSFEAVRKRVFALTGRADPGRVDMSKLLPATYAFLMVIVGLTVLLLAADILNPVQLTS
jgi:membrane-associated protease RseP (regulator of RpoE activity)